LMMGELRCEMCGKLGLQVAAHAILCAGCSDVWVVYHCERCGVRMMSQSSESPAGPLDGLCCFCRMRARLNEVPEADRKRILATALERGRLNGIRELRQLLGWPLREAVLAIEVLYPSGEGHA
jgi:hypothetical protein